jgi:PhnB protein
MKDERTEPGNTPGRRERAAGNGVPEGYPNVSPWITTGNTAKLIEFLKEAFDAQETQGSRYINDDGSIAHAEVRIGDSVILMFDAKPEWPTIQSLLRLYVVDADKAFHKAIAAGAAPVTRMTTLAFGDRVGRVRDPFGNIWWIQSHMEDVDEKKMMERLQEPGAKEAMKYVEQSLEWELGKNVQHADLLDRT